MVPAWCCLRHGFRKFQLHLIASVPCTKDSFHPRRVPLLREFLQEMRAERRTGQAALDAPRPKSPI